MHAPSHHHHIRLLSTRTYSHPHHIPLPLTPTRRSSPSIQLSPPPTSSHRPIRRQPSPLSVTAVTPTRLCVLDSPRDPPAYFVANLASPLNSSTIRYCLSSLRLDGPSLRPFPSCNTVPTCTLSPRPRPRYAPVRIAIHSFTRHCRVLQFHVGPNTPA